MVKVCITTDVILQDFEKAVNIAKELGVDGIDIRSLWYKSVQQLTTNEVKKVKSLLAEAELDVVMISPQLFKCDIEEESHFKDHLTILKNCIEIAKQLDTDLVRSFGFWKKGNQEYKQENKDEFHEKVVARYQGAVNIAESEGVIIAVENEASTFIGTARDTVRLLKDLNSKSLKSLWDPGNAFDLGEIPYPEGYELVKDFLVHMHLKDVSSETTPELWKHIPWIESEKKGALRSYYVNVLRAMKRDQYKGAISLESVPWLNLVEPPQHRHTAFSVMPFYFPSFRYHPLPPINDIFERVKKEWKVAKALVDEAIN